MRIAVIGTGYVGLVSGAGFADFANDVTCVDIDAARIAMLERGEVPFYEPGLAELVARNRHQGRLRFTTSTADAVARAEVVFIAVGTPSDKAGNADLRYVIEAARDIGRAITGYTVVVTKSTVPVGTADQVRAAIAAETTHPFAVGSNPEFLKEGDAVNDFLRPSRVVVGADDPRAVEVLRRLYTGFLRTSDRIQVMSVRSAELTKYAANAMLATRISFMNELALLAEKVGADIDKVRVAIGADPRIGPKFLFAGGGFGGSCLIGSETVLLRERGVVRLARLDSLFPRATGPTTDVVVPEKLEVLAMERLGGPPAFMEVESVTRRPYEGELCEVRTKMGRRVRCTPDHPFVVVDAEGRHAGVAMAEELTEDSWLPLAFGAARNAAVEELAEFDILAPQLEAGLAPDRVIVRLPGGAKSEAITEALRPVVRDKTRLGDIRSCGALRLAEAQAANLDLTGATIGTSRSGTYVPIRIAASERFWRIIGLYLAEGWTTTDLGRDGARRMRIAWSFHPRDEEDLVDEVVEYWQSLGIKASVFSPTTSRKVSVSSRLLATWMLRTLRVGADCYNKRIPDALWSAPVGHKLAFLSGLWHGDGSWSYVANRRGVVLEYGTVSRELADGVVRLLGELGIVVSWKIGRPPGSTVDTHFLRISGAGQVENLLDLCKPRHHERIRRSIDAQEKRIAPTGYRHEPARVRVVSVEKSQFQGHVYSLEVPYAETFATTGGLIVHNCFPKDLRALAHTGREHDQPMTIVDAVNAANERQKKLLGERIIARLGGDLAGKRVAVWGLAFKPETDDIRESPALTLIRQLAGAGAEVRGYDPAAMPNIAREQLPVTLVEDPYAAAEGADAVALVTEWHALRHPDYARLAQSMRTRELFDGRNVWNPDEARAAGFHYQGIGRP